MKSSNKRKTLTALTGLYLNCQDYFVGGIGIMLFNLDFFVLQTFFEAIYASWSQKEEISRSTSPCMILHLCLTLSLWKFQNRLCSPTISCDYHLLYFDLQLHWRNYCPRGPQTILLSLKQCDPRSLRSGAKDLVRRWTCWFHQVYASFGFFADENEQEVFLRVFVQT